MVQAVNLGGGGFEKPARHDAAALQAEPTASQLAAANDITDCPLS